MKFTSLRLLPLFALVVSSRLRRRDSNDSEYTTISVPVAVNNNSYSVSVVMSTDASAQHFSFGFTTSTGYATVAGTRCQTCDGVQSYNRTESTTATDLPGGQNVAIIGGASADGNLITENCGLKKSDGQDRSYANQTTVVTKQSNSMFSPGISGILGLDPIQETGISMPRSSVVTFQDSQSVKILLTV